MYQIRTWLSIGKFRETNEQSLMEYHEVGAILQLAAPISYDHIPSLYIPVEDGVFLPPELLRQGVTFARAKKAEGCKVVVACGAGVSRSVTFAMAVLHEEEGISLLEAFEEIEAVHRNALPHLELLKSLGTYYVSEKESVRKLLARIWMFDEKTT